VTRIYFCLPFGLSCRTIRTQAVYIKVYRSEIRIDVPETTGLVCAASWKKKEGTLEHRYTRAKNGVRVSALGTRNKITPFSAAKSATWMSSPFSFLRVTLGKLPPSSILGRAAASASSSSSSSSAFALLKKKIQLADRFGYKKEKKKSSTNLLRSRSLTFLRIIYIFSRPLLRRLRFCCLGFWGFSWRRSGRQSCNSPRATWFSVGNLSRSHGCWLKKSTDRVSLLGSLSHGLQRAARCFGQCHWSRGSGHGQAQFLF